MKETLKDAHKLAEQIKATYGEEVLEMSQMLRLVANLCPFMGHTNHELIANCALVYCEAKGIDVDKVNACTEDMVKAEQTISELLMLETGESRLQGQGVGDEFFARFKKGG